MQSTSHLLSNSEQEICEETWPTDSGAGRQLTEKDIPPTLIQGKGGGLAVEAKPRICAQRSNLRILFLTKIDFKKCY